MAESKPAATPAKSPDVAATMSQAHASIETSRTGAASAKPGNVQAETPIPKNFGRYKIERELGKGAMGVVYLAEDTHLIRPVALKIPKQSILEDPDSLERFYREAKITSQIRHPNICQVFDVGAIDGTHFLTMEYVPGKTIGSFITPAKLPAARQVALLFRKIALALDEAHSQGVIHRDLKPSNVMLDKGGEPKVMDFGLARQTNTIDQARLTQSGAILGTPAYMSPEQVRGEANQVGPQSDIYALGVMLYQFLTGELPFSGPIMMVFAQILTEQPKKPSEVRPDVDSTLEAICLRMMAKDKSQRYASMKEVAAALTGYLKTGSAKSPESAAAPVSPVLTAAVPEPEVDTLSMLPDFPATPIRATKKSKGKNQLRKSTRPFWTAVSFVGGIAAVILFAVILVLKNDKVAVQIKIDDPTAVVKVDGQQVQIGSDGLGKINLTLAEHTFIVERGDETIRGPERFTITKNGTRLLDVSTNPPEPATPTSVQTTTVNPLGQLPITESVRMEHIKHLLGLGATIQFTAPDTSTVTSISSADNVTAEVTKDRITGLVFLNANPIAAAELDVLAHLPNLERLYFYSLRQSLETWGQLIRVPRLQYLQLGTLNDDVIKSLPKLPQLKYLQCQNSLALTSDGLSQLSKFALLEELNLSFSNLTDDDMDSLPELPRLKTFRGVFKQLTGRCGPRVVSTCPNLESLDFADTPIKSEEMTWLSELKLNSLTIGIREDLHIGDLPHLSKLQTLTIGLWHLPPAQPAHLSAKDFMWMNQQPQLASLNLHSTQDDFVAELKPLPGIKSLSLISAIGNISVSDFSSLRQFSQLQQLQLGNLPLSDNDVVHILDLPNLKSLVVSGSKLTSVGIDRLKAGLPRCQVTVYLSPEAKSQSVSTSPTSPPSAIAPFDAKQARAHQEAWAKHLGVPVEWENSIGMKFALIPPGEFMMGSTPEEIEAALKIVGDDKHWQECIKSEAPKHNVILTKPIYLGLNEVRQAEYENVMRMNPSGFAKSGPEQQYVEKVAGIDTSSHPVENVSWNDAVEFCAKLSQREKLKAFNLLAGEAITTFDGTGYRLPSEAEWEFACRAGTTTKYWIGDQDEDLERVGWYSKNSGGRTHAAGELKANPYSLCDMHGNVCEWVQDCWDATNYGQFQEKPAINPGTTLPLGSPRVVRGGVWYSSASACRSSDRYATDPSFRLRSVGFRVALSVDAVKRAPAGELKSGDTKPPADARKAVLDRYFQTGAQLNLRYESGLTKSCKSAGDVPDGVPVMIHLNLVPETDIDGFLRTSPSVFNLAQFQQIVDRHVSIRNPRFSDEQLAAVGKLPGISTLFLMEANVTDKGIESLSSARALYQLTISGGRVTGVGLAGLRDLPSLKSVMLQSNMVTDEGLNAVGLLPQLWAIYIYTTSPEVETAYTSKGLESLKQLTNLGYLHLDIDESVRSESVAVVLAGKTKLNGLVLRYSKCDERVVGAIASLNALQQLSLTGQNVSGKGFDRWAGLTQLTFMAIHSGTVTDESLKDLSALSRLKSLYVTDNRETIGEGLKHFRNDSQMGVLDLTRTKVRKKSLEQFRAAHPNCKVIAPDSNYVIED